MTIAVAMVLLAFLMVMAHVCALVSFALILMPARLRFWVIAFAVPVLMVAIS